MTIDLKIMYDSLVNNYSTESLVSFSESFHTDFKDIPFSDTKFGRYIPNLFFDFFNPDEFKTISNRVIKEEDAPNTNFSTLLFRLSLEINSDKTNTEKEMIYDFVFSIISKSNETFNSGVHYSIGFVASQAAQLGLDISPTIHILPKLVKKHSPYLEEGFIDGMSNMYPHILSNDKFFNLFSSLYEKWGETSKLLLRKMYEDFIPGAPHKKLFNPGNSQTFFWLNSFFTNDSLKNYIKNYCVKSFESQMEPLQVNDLLEKKYLALKQDIKIEKDKNQKLLQFIEPLKSNFEGLKEINPLQEQSTQILSQIIKNQQDYIKRLEEYKVESEKSAKLKSGIKKVL